mgnify:CR=1 FL=1
MEIPEEDYNILKTRINYNLKKKTKIFIKLLNKGTNSSTFKRVMDEKEADYTALVTIIDDELHFGYFFNQKKLFAKISPKLNETFYIC